LRKRNLLISSGAGLVLITGSLTVGATAFASTPAPPALKACVVNSTGVMHQVSSHTSKCARGQHLITWNQTGVPGGRGAAGARGPQGIPGVKGDKGADGARVLTGSGTPTTVKPSVKAGDLYLDLKTGTLWSYDGKGFVNPIVLEGQNGTPGSTIVTGEGDPTTVQPKVNPGDLYLDLETADLYPVKTATTFGEPVALKGAAGTQFRTGSTDPVAQAADAENDLYLNTTSGDLFKFDGTDWKVDTSLKGEQGDAGTQFKTGTDDPEADPASPVAGVTNDLYLNTTTDEVFKFDGEHWASVGSFKGKQGDAGTKFKTGSTDPGTSVPGAENDLYLNTVTGKVFVLHGTTWEDDGSLKGPGGEAGKSLNVQRVPVASPFLDNTDPTHSTLTMKCAAGTAIGAGYSGVDPAAHLIGSDAVAGQDDEWVLTFDADPTANNATVTGTALCATQTP
jgi:hypothetical protein